MLKSMLVICLSAFLIGVFLGCKTADRADTAKSSDQANGTNGDPKPGDGVEGHQYRAVCIEKEAHGGNEQVLSRWLDSREKAYELGNYHSDFKENGHRWKIEDRVKP